MKNSKIVALVATAALLVLGAAFTSMAASYNWYQQDGEWRCKNASGDDYYSEWAKSGADWYWLDDDGWMAREALVDDDTKYVDADGKMVKNQWVKLADDEGNEYWNYFQAGGKKMVGKDDKLLKWVIEKTPYNKNNPQDYGSLFWTKQCDGKVKLHANTFKLLHKKYTDPNEPKKWIILDGIQNYIEYLVDKEQSKNENLSAVDRLKILANMAYFAEQYKYDKDYKDSNKMMGRFRSFLGESDKKILKENNYFGLPKFKEWWDNADYDVYVVGGEYEGAWGTGFQPMSEEEWRKKHPKK